MIEKIGLHEISFISSAQEEKGVENESQKSSGSSGRASMRRFQAEGRVFEQAILDKLSLESLISECENNPSGWPGLHWAIEKLHRPDVALAILEQRPDENKMSIPSYTRKFDDVSCLDGIGADAYKDIHSALTLAILNGYEDVVLALLKGGANPNERVSKTDEKVVFGRIPFVAVTFRTISLLGLALREKQNGIAKMLLEYGASPIDVDVVTFDQLGNTFSDSSALTYAQENFPEDRELVRMIIQAILKEKNIPLSTTTDFDVDLVIKYSKGSLGQIVTPLNNAFIARDYEGAKRLLELGIYDDSPGTPLSIYILAARESDIRFLDLLLDKGFDPKKFSMSMILFTENIDALGRLLDRGVPFPKDAPLEFIARSIKVYEFLLSRAIPLDKKQVFHSAIAHGSLPVVEMILKEGGDQMRGWALEGIKVANRYHQKEIRKVLRDYLKE